VVHCFEKCEHANLCAKYPPIEGLDWITGRFDDTHGMGTDNALGGLLTRDAVAASA
jgi:hypothetical protein